MRNVILFGPPGIGKSSYIRELVTRGLHAIDLEWLWPNDIRHELPITTQDQGIVFGAADLDPKKDYGNAIKIFLDLDQERYDARRARRDSGQPGKASQKKHLVSDWRVGTKYDIVFNTQGKFSHRVHDLYYLIKKLWRQEVRDGKKATKS